MNAYGYIRVSTTKQTDSGHSLEAQEEKIRAYCKMRGFDLSVLFVDPGQSGSKPLRTRDEGEKLDQSLVKGDHVVVTKLDRAFRNAVDCLSTVADWDKKGVALHLLDLGGVSIDTKTPAGKMFLTMIAGFAEMERALVSERTKVVVQHLKAQGRVAGQIPYGYKRDGNFVVICEDEQRTLALIRQLYKEGKTYSKITRHLNENGIYTKSGKPWQRYTVQKLLGEG